MKSWRNKYLKIHSKAILNKGQKGEYLKKLLSCTGSSLLIDQSFTILEQGRNVQKLKKDMGNIPSHA